MFGKPKKYAAVNIITGVIVKEFSSQKKLVKYLFKPKKFGIENITPYGLFVRGAINNGDGSHSLIEFVEG